MALTEMQKELIERNAHLPYTEISKLAKCHVNTVSLYFKNKNKHNLPTEKTTGTTKPPQNSRAHAIETATHKLCGLDESVILTNEQLGLMQTLFCVAEFNLYKDATDRLSKDPDNPKILFTQRQHAEQFQKGMLLHGKWNGMSEGTVNLNVSGKVLLTEKDIETMSFDDITAVVIDQCQQKQ